MSLKALLLCSDAKIERLLRRVLGDLDIAVELCLDADSALRKLTRQRFEAVIVDCADDGANEVLRSVRNAPCNKQAVAVAIVEPIVGLKAVFDVGAHFVLYRPVSSERAKSSFRAARALMKSERRRNARIAVQIPVVMRSTGPGNNMKVQTVDLSEGGMAVKVQRGRRPTGRWQIAFSLPGTQISLELPAEFAWEGTADQAGLRFQQVPAGSAAAVARLAETEFSGGGTRRSADSLPAHRSEPGRMLLGNRIAVSGVDSRGTVDAGCRSGSAGAGPGADYAS